MLNDRDGPQSPMHPPGDQPALVRLSRGGDGNRRSCTTDTGFADLFLLCMAAAGTVLGSLVGSGALLDAIRWSTGANIRLDDRSPCLSGISEVLVAARSLWSSCLQKTSFALRDRETDPERRG